jgi:protein-tyrosine-phosphatase
VTRVSESEPASRPQAVLFACGHNAVRSPMAAALCRQMFGVPLYVASAGVRKEALDPFAVAAMDEIGIDMSAHEPRTFEELEDLEGLSFDLIVTLAPEAHHKALALTHRIAAGVEGNREQRLDAYRAVRDQLMARIKARFA